MAVTYVQGWSNRAEQFYRNADVKCVCIQDPISTTRNTLLECTYWDAIQWSYSSSDDADSQGVMFLCECKMNNWELSRMLRVPREGGSPLQLVRE